MGEQQQEIVALAADAPTDSPHQDADAAEGEERGGEAGEAAEEEAREKARREREARAQALTLEIVGDLPYAEVKPPENVLFVCKLNPVTEGLSELGLSCVGLQGLTNSR